MFTVVDLGIAAVVGAIVAGFSTLFMLGATLQEREGQAYQEGFYKGHDARTNPRTNGDKIRALRDEELADKIVKLDIDDMIPYCRCDNALCNEMLNRDELVPAEICKACCVRWLQKEAQ